ncbi:MAG: hypothetical protein ACREAD_04670 [Nitrosopumilaceae archaeon]
MGKVVYLLIVLSFVVGITIGSSTNVIAQQASIPSWVKDTALWWGQGKISDSEFVRAIQYLISQKILTVPNALPVNSTTQKPSPVNSTTQQKPTPLPPVNPLSAYLPSQDDIGTRWSAQGEAVHSKYLDSKGATKSIEQVYVKTNTASNVATVDIGEFNSDSSARSVLSQNTAFWKQERFATWQFQSDTSIPCIAIARATSQVSAIDMVCIVGRTVIQFDVNGIGVDNDMNLIANSVLKRFPLNAAIQ